MRYLLLLFVALFVLGCNDVTRLNDKTYPAKPKNSPIEVFYGDTPTRPFEKIALLRTSSAWSTSGENMLIELKQEARKVGADAILLQGIGVEHTSGGAIVSSSPNGVSTVTSTDSSKGVGNAIAIRWTDAPPAPPAPVATAPQSAPATGPIASAVGLRTWQLTVNSNPQGALIQAYDSNQALVQIGRTPVVLVWPLQTPADTMVLFWQGRQLALLPSATSGQGVYVDFLKQPPEVNGATLLPAGR